MLCRSLKRERKAFVSVSFWTVKLKCGLNGDTFTAQHRKDRFDVKEEAEAAFAAFYADCLHEVLPITSGHRLALIYNLVRSGPGPLPRRGTGLPATPPTNAEPEPRRRWKPGWRRA